MAFLNNTNTPKQKSIDEKPKKRRRVKKEEMSEETENNNKNEGFDLINSLIDLNEGNLTTDDSPSDLTMLDAEFGNNGGENNINDEDSGNEGFLNKCVCVNFEKKMKNKWDQMSEIFFFLPTLLLNCFIIVRHSPSLLNINRGVS